MQNGASWRNWDMNLNNWVTLLASSELINPSIIQDKLWLATALSGLSSDWTSRSPKVEKKGYDGIKCILTVWISRCHQQSSFKSVKQLGLTFSCGVMSWCYFRNLSKRRQRAPRHQVMRSTKTKTPWFYSIERPTVITDGWWTDVVGSTS